MTSYIFTFYIYNTNYDELVEAGLEGPQVMSCSDFQITVKSHSKSIPCSFYPAPIQKIDK